MMLGLVRANLSLVVFELPHEGQVLPAAITGDSDTF